MLRLKRHIASHVVRSVFLMLAILLGLFAIGMLADEMNELSAQYRWRDLLLDIALRLPGVAVENIGFAMLIGCLLGLGILANQSELTVIRASGVSVFRISWLVMRPMLWLILLFSLLAEYVAPQVERMADALRIQAIDQGRQNTLDSRKGLWLRSGNDFLHFNTVLPNGMMFGFARLQFADDGQLVSAQYAPKAIFDQQGWRLENLRITRFLADRTETVSDASDNPHWETELTPELLSVVVADPENLSLRELHAYSHYLERQSQDNSQFRLVFWEKALRPFAMAGLVLVAISFIFGPLRSTTMGYRLFTGVMVGITFSFAQKLLGPSSLVYGFSPFIAVALPIAVCWIAATILLQRAR